MKIKGNIFDKDGQAYYSDNIDIYIGEMKDKLLVEVYKSTIYQHELISTIEELITKGLMEKEEGSKPYDSKLTENSIESMKLELVERFDEKFHDEVVNSIDLSFIKNKPKNI